MAMKLDLFPYQWDAFDMFMERGSELLAFDMGLGKTATSIAICEDLLERRKIRTSLLVVPAGLKFQWAKALAKFTDCPTRTIKLKRQPVEVPALESCIIIDGTPEQRARQYALARELRPEYVIIGVDQVAMEPVEIRSLRATMVVLDEASCIKSPGSQRSIAVKENLNYPYRLALTGTPIENKPEDVFSIMEFVDASVLGRAHLFDKSYIVRDSFGTVKRYKNLDVLNLRLSEAMCRKTWADPDVAPYLPEIHYDTWVIYPDDATMDVYKVMARDLLDEYNKAASDMPSMGKFSVAAHYAGLGGKGTGIMGKLMPIHTCMEMLLDHPHLIRYSRDKYLTTETQGSEYAHKFLKKICDDLPGTTPKKDYVVLRTQQILWESTENKVLIFTRYREMVDILVRDFQDLGWGVTEYHGEMTNRQKEASVSRFLTDKECRLFISSHAGAYGVDMPVANYLVNYDIPWAAGLARQINGRHVRASSEHHDVYVVNVVTEGTIEERKLEMKDFKDAISDAAVDGMTLNGDLVNDVTALRLHCMAVLGLTD
jgi:SNF2 family DNA or RNA helicase